MKKVFSKPVCTGREKTFLKSRQISAGYQMAADVPEAIHHVSEADD